MNRGDMVGSGGVPLVEVQRLDRELSALAKKSGPLRFALGRGLDVMARTRGFTKLAFPSIEAYALERCERSTRWAQQSRQLARRAEKLPLLTRALKSGTNSWSMALEVAKVATPEDEAAWLQQAASSTVAQVRRAVEARRAANVEAAGDSSEDDALLESEREEHCLLTVTVDREDSWLWECARMLARHLDAPTTNDAVEAVLGETVTALLPLVPRESADYMQATPTHDLQQAWNRQLATWREEAEEMCEPRIPSWTGAAANRPPCGEEGRFEAVLDFSGPPEAIDAELRKLSASLEARELTLGELAEDFWQADGWRRLGYATPAQYCRERLGMSRSSLQDKRQLARRLRQLPAISKAHREHVIGYEATRVVASVATSETDAVWATRAAERTVVHLREDVEVAEMLSRLDVTEAVLPPTPEDVYEMRAVRSSIVTGAAFREPPNDVPQLPGSEGQKSAADAVFAAMTGAVVNARRAPIHIRSRGRVALRLRVKPEVRAWYRAAERLYVTHGPRMKPFFRFACLALIDEWAREQPKVAYSAIYARDGLRCTNPFCTTRTCTPHHVIFRARGGTDKPWNVTTLCPTCHFLEGVHRGYIGVSGAAPYLTWSLGGHTVVQSRTRIRRDASIRVPRAA